MSEHTWMPFNVNDSVRVRLTDFGRRQWDKWHRELMPEYPPPPLREVDGVYETQLWSLMQVFGEAIHLGGPNLFETTIELRIDGGFSRCNEAYRYV